MAALTTPTPTPPAYAGAGFGGQVRRLASLDAAPEVVGAEYTGLYFRSHRLRPVEDLALDRVTYGELRRRLTGQQAQYLSLRLQGYTSREITAIMGVTRWEGARLRQEIKRQAADISLAATPCTP